MLIINNYLKSLSPDFSGDKYKISVNEFHWALVEKHEIPISYLKNKSNKPSLSNKWISEPKLAILVSKNLIKPTYQMKGVWDTSKTLEEGFLSINLDKKPIPNATLQTVWAATWIQPKEKLFLLPFQVAAAIVGNVIFVHSSLENQKYKAKFAARTAAEVMQFWGSNLFGDGILQIPSDEFPTEKSFLDFCIAV